MKPAYEDDESIIGDMLILKHTTTEALEALGATLNFIDKWIELIEDKYDKRCVAYSNPIKYIIKQIPLKIIKSLTPKQTVQKLMTEIGGELCMEKSAKVLTTLRRLTLLQGF